MIIQKRDQGLDNGQMVSIPFYIERALLNCLYAFHSIEEWHKRIGVIVKKMELKKY